MFNVEEAIAEWRRQMAAVGIDKPETLDELESHLRDALEHGVRSGSSEGQAFEAAVRQIGQAAALKCEFAKLRRPRDDRKLNFLLKCAAGVLLVGYAVLVSASVIFQVAMTLEMQLLSFVTAAAILFTICACRYFVRLVSANRDATEKSGAFDLNAKKVLEFAQAEAPLLCHDFVGTEHILLGLLRLETGVVANILRRSGVDREAVMMEIKKFVGIGPDHEMAAAIPYTPRVTKALRIAAMEARALHHAHVGAEHIFLGLLLEGEGVAAVVLKNLGIRTNETRQEILREMHL